MINESKKRRFYVTARAFTDNYLDSMYVSAIFTVSNPITEGVLERWRKEIMGKYESIGSVIITNWKELEG